MTPYSPALEAFIKNPTATISPETKAEIKVEVDGLIVNRPVVVLKNDKTTLSYHRPGVAREIQAACITAMGIIVDTPAQPTLNPTADDFSDLSKPPRCSKNPSDLLQLYAVCERVGLLRELYLEVITHDTDYFQQSITNNNLLFTPLGLEECACRSNRGNRIFADSRYSFEEHFVAHITATVAKDQCVKVLSLGNGKLLQEWKSIGLLIKEGYREFEWILVDPINSKLAPIAAFKDFFAKLPGIQMHITAYDRLSDVPKCQLHAVTMVDASEEVFNEILAALEYLAPEGKLIQAGGNNFYAVSPSGITVLKQSYTITEICEDMLQIVPEGYTAPIKLVAFEFWIYGLNAIDTLIHQGVKEIHLLLLDHDIEVAHYATLFPTITLTIEKATTDEFEARLSSREHFDFIITVQPEEETKRDLGIEESQKIPSHSLGQSTTAYLRDETSLTIFSWNNASRGF